MTDDDSKIKDFINSLIAHAEIKNFHGEAIDHPDNDKDFFGFYIPPKEAANLQALAQAAFGKEAVELQKDDIGDTILYIQGAHKNKVKKYIMDLQPSGPFTSEKAKERFCSYHDLLEQIFSPPLFHDAFIVHNGDFIDGQKKGPYIVAGVPISKIAKMVFRIEEYVLGRKLSPDEREERENAGEGVHFSMALFEQPEITLPRLRQFVEAFQKQDELVKNGTHFQTSADEAAVALAAWTGLGWHSDYYENTQFNVQQLRIETDELPNAKAVADLINDKVGLSGEKLKLAYVKDNKVFIGVNFLTKDQLHKMEGSSLALEINRINSTDLSQGAGIE